MLAGDGEMHPQPGASRNRGDGDFSRGYGIVGLKGSTTWLSLDQALGRSAGIHSDLRQRRIYFVLNEAIASTIGRLGEAGNPASKNEDWARRGCGCGESSRSAESDRP